MADGVNPLDHAISKNDSEIRVVIGFLQDCQLNCAFPFKAIPRVDAFEPLFPHRRSQSRIKTVNPVPLLGKVYCTPIRRIPGPAAHVSKPLSLGKVELGWAALFDLEIDADPALL